MPQTKTVSNPVKPRVIVCVTDGIAKLICKPGGLEVLILDYDLAGADSDEHDPDGQLCCTQTFAAEQIVRDHKHWPLVKSAVRRLSNAIRPTPQRWRCPQCERTVNSTDESLAEGGTPYCPTCDRDMEMV